jgi:hypothetical protein
VEGHITKLKLMQRQRVAVGLVVLALLASAALMHARETNLIVQTVVSAVLMAIDVPSSTLVAP